MPKVIPHYTDDAKRRIILAAMETMAESGYEEVKINDVARKIGVTKGAVYWYFRSKNEMIQEVLMTIENEMEKIAADQYFDQFDDQVLPDAFDRIFFSEDNQRTLLFEAGLLRDPGEGIEKVTPESVHELVLAIETGIKKVQKKGHLRSLTDGKTLALALTMLGSGLQRGEIYARLFLGRPKIQRTWFFAMKLLMKPATRASSRRTQ